MIKRVFILISLLFVPVFATFAEDGQQGNTINIGTASDKNIPLRITDMDSVLSGAGLRPYCKERFYNTLIVFGAPFSLTELYSACAGTGSDCNSLDKCKNIVGQYLGKIKTGGAEVPKNPTTTSPTAGCKLTFDHEDKTIIIEDVDHIHEFVGSSSGGGRSIFGYDSKNNLINSGGNENVQGFEIRGNDNKVQKYVSLTELKQVDDKAIQISELGEAKVDNIVFKCGGFKDGVKIGYICKTKYTGGKKIGKYDIGTEKYDVYDECKEPDEKTAKESSEEESSESGGESDLSPVDE